MKNRNVLLTVAVFLGMISGLTAQNVPSYVPTNGLVGWWPFNGNANDESGNGNNGTVNGVTLTADRFGNEGKAYYFDGNSKITLNQHLLDGAFSVVVWLKVTENQPGLHGIGTIFSNGIQHGNWGNGIQGGISELNDQITFEKNAHQISGGFGFQNLQPIPFNDGSFHCIVYSWNGNSGPNSAFIHHNGDLLASGACLSTLINSSRNLEIGIGTDGGATYPFKGTLDDFIIYNRALTQQEITALYQGNNTTTNCLDLPNNLKQGLVGYWPFCGNANDESENGNNGTVNGATLTADRFGNINSAYSFPDNAQTRNITMQNFWGVTGQNNRTISVWYLQENSLNNDIQVLCGSGSYVAPGTAFTPSLYQGRIGIEVNEIFRYYSLSPVNQWNNAVFIYETGNDIGGVKVYLNGIFQTEETLTQGDQNVLLNTGSVIPFVINTGGNLSNTMIGKIDDIAIWNRALSPQEITQLYNQGICKTSITVTDTLLIHTGITSYNPVAYQNTLKVWPNPGNQDITIDAGNLALMQGWKIRVSNAQGVQIYPSANQSGLINQQQQTLDMSGWGGNGLYFLYLIDPQSNIQEVKKIVLAP